MRRFAWGAFLAAALTAFLPGMREADTRGHVSESDGRDGHPRPSVGRVSLPVEFEGEKLVVEPLTEREAAYANGFPGAIGRFRAGEKVVILRQVDRATYRVHSAATCLAASGWSVEPLPAERRASGDWSRFRAAKGGETLLVREQIRAADGTTIADVPSWFWSAFLGQTKGPWLVMTVVVRAAPAD